MKTLISILVLFSSTVFAEDMIPLGKYLDQNKFEENEMFYVFSRCSAINYKMMDLSKNITELEERSKLLHDFFYQFSTMIRTKIIPSDSQDEHLRISALTIGGIIDSYTEVSNKHYLNTGTYFTDFMIEDVEICSGIYERSK